MEHLGDGEGGGRGGEQEAGRDGSADGRRRVLDGLRSYGWWVAAGTCFRLSAGRGVRITAAGLEPADAMRLPSDFAAVLGESEGAYGGERGAREGQARLRARSSK